MMNAHLAPALLLALVACGPRSSAAVEPLSVSGAEARAMHQVADRLERENGDLAQPSARLARSLAEGQADLEVRRAALALFAAMDREHLEAPVECPPCDPCPEGASPDTGTPEADPDGEAALERALVQTAGESLEAVRSALRRADYAEALAHLEPLRDSPAWPSAEPYWVEAVDGFVGAERERAGALYVEAREAPRHQRRAALLEVRAILAELIDRYPESAYVQPLQVNLERVERELEMLE